MASAPRDVVRDTALDPPTSVRADHQLSWRVEEHGSVLRFELDGEMDISSVIDLKRDVHDKVLLLRPEVVVFELGGVTFIDSTGVRFLVDARTQLGSWGTHVLLEGPSEPVRTLLRASGVAGLFSYLNGWSIEEYACPVCDHELPGRTDGCPFCGSVF